MMEVLRSINAPLMIPMHFFGPSTLNRFLSSAREYFPVEFSDTPAITLARAAAANSPKILVLPGHYTASYMNSPNPLTFNQRVLGSSPSALTNNIKGLPASAL